MHSSPGHSPLSLPLCNPLRKSEVAPCERKSVLPQNAKSRGSPGGRRRGTPRQNVLSGCSIFPPSLRPLVIAVCARLGWAEGWSTKPVNHFLFSLRTAVDWRERPLCAPSRPASQQMRRVAPSGACLHRGGRRREAKKMTDRPNASALTCPLTAPRCGV